MVKEHQKFIKRESFLELTLVISRMINTMDRGFIYGPMEKNMLENLEMANEMGKEPSHRLMEKINILENGKMIKHMAKELGQS